MLKVKDSKYARRYLMMIESNLGGSGSGNYGHKGRPGQIGGSSKSNYQKLPSSYDVWSDNGIGNIPFQQSDSGRAEKITMSAYEYLGYAPPRPGGQDSTKYLGDKLSKGEKFAPPVLFVEWNKKLNEWQVVQHEGRNRVTTFINLYGNKDIPVTLVFEGNLRARDVTGKMLRAPIRAQEFSITTIDLGGPGSGYSKEEGHKGRPGQVGGSQPSTISDSFNYEEQASLGVYKTKRGTVVYDPTDLIDYKNPSAHIYGEDKANDILSLNQLRQLSPDRTITVKGYQNRRGGVRRHNIKVKELVLYWK